MIEENIAIICSCLPMMRGPLSICFPSIFTPRTKTSNYESGDISNGNSTTGSGGLRSPRNQWTQLHGYPDHRAGINLNEISASQKRVSGDSTGQILPPADPGPNHQRRSRSDASGIRKVLQYQVSYAQREASHSDDEEKT